MISNRPVVTVIAALSGVRPVANAFGAGSSTTYSGGAANESLALAVNTAVSTQFKVEVQAPGGDTARLDNYFVLLVR